MITERQSWETLNTDTAVNKQTQKNNVNMLLSNTKRELDF